MGQATADLPNSTEKPAEPIGNADEMLSQLAGEEIDRLLAEADAHPADQNVQAANAEGQTPSIASPQGTDEFSPETESAIKEMPLVTGEELDEQLAAVAAANRPGADPFEDQVNELFNELKDLPEESPPSPAAADIPPHSPGSKQPADPALATEIENPTNAAERAALQAPVTLVEPSPQPAPEPAVEVKPSVVVRILEVVNSPVNALPDSIRDLVGKVAILTLMNSIGVLLYLFLFRK